MWTRRVLLATMVAAAAMSLPKTVPASFGSGAGAQIQSAALGSFR